MAQLVKNPRAMQETWVRSLDWDNPLEKGKATHSIILACRVHGVTKCWTRLSDFHFHLVTPCTVALQDPLSMGFSR